MSGSPNRRAAFEKWRVFRFSLVAADINEVRPYSGDSVGHRVTFPDTVRVCSLMCADAVPYFSCTGHLRSA